MTLDAKLKVKSQVPESDTCEVRKPITTFTGLAAISLIALLGLGLRAAAMDWGLVTDASLRAAHYPEASLNPGAGAVAGGKQGRIYGSYVYDELSFSRFIAWFARAEAIVEQKRDGKIGAMQTVWRLYKAAYVEGGLSLNPVAPMIYGMLTAAMATGVYGIPLDSETSLGDSYHVHGDWMTAFFRIGRWLSVLTCLPVMLAFVWLWSLVGQRRDWSWLGIGAFAYMFQPTLVTHGRLITYNIGMCLIELIFLGLVAALLGHDKIRRKSRGVAALAGLVLGIGIATKITIMPIAAVAFVALAHQAWRRIPTLGLRACQVPALLFSTAGLVTFFLWYPGLTSPQGHLGLENQGQMLTGLSHWDDGNYFTYARYYFFHTLPAAFGWPLYFTGIAAMAFALWRVRHATAVQNLILFSLLLWLLLYPLNFLGTEIQRAQSVIVFLLLLAGGFLSHLGRVTLPLPSKNDSPPPWRPGAGRRLIAAWSLYLLVGMAFASIVSTVLFRRDQPGYRTALSAWVLKNIPPGESIWAEGSHAHTFSDISMVEIWGQSRRPLYRWTLKVPESFCREKPMAWGHYHDDCPCGDPKKAFLSPSKIENRSLIIWRKALGYPRWEQRLTQPNYVVFAPFPPREPGHSP